MYTLTNITTTNVSIPYGTTGINLTPGGSYANVPALTTEMSAALAAGKITISGTEGSNATGAVTQITSIVTGVTLNAQRGLVTTFSASAAADATQKFTVTNSFASATSNIRAYIVDYAGAYSTNGNPTVAVDNRGAGTFEISITNAHSANALSGALVIGFEIVA